MKHVYLLWLKNKYPECHEPDKDAHAIFASKSDLNKALKEARVHSPWLYDEDDIEVQRVPLNKMYGI